MDATATISIGLLLAIAGAIGAVTAIMTNRDTKKIKEGKFEGVVETELKNLSTLLNNNMGIQASLMSDLNLFKKEVQGEFDTLGYRMTVLETKHTMNHKAPTHRLTSE